MNSQEPNQTANPTTTAADEISRFARYVEFKTRDLRHTVASYLGTNSTDQAAEQRIQDPDDDLFVDVGIPEEGWIAVTDEAVDVPEVRSPFSAQVLPIIFLSSCETIWALHH